MKKTLFLTAAITLLSTITYAQDYEFKELKQTSIKGAPRLTAPKFLKDANDKIIFAEKYGHAAPAIYDWDGDGKLDLLVGEFGGGNKANILIFKNIGKNKKPKYSAESYYAKDKTGANLFISGSWCQGFIPQFVDIDGDGINDITSGEYGGKTTYYKGTKDGYEAPKQIKEKLDITNRDLFYDYLFTNPTFYDYNGDGLLDAFLGGAKGMRYMLNVGTEENPVFGERMPILDVDGNQICIRDLTAKEKEAFGKPGAKMTTTDFKTYVHHIDWDNDGIKDIIATSGYYKGDAVLFFKGIKTKDGIRFAERVPLFTAADGAKALPGSILIPYFYDINGDGALDLLLGVSSLFDENGNMLDKWQKGAKSKGSVILMLSKKHYKK